MAGEGLTCRAIVLLDMYLLGTKSNPMKGLNAGNSIVRCVGVLARYGTSSTLADARGAETQRIPVWRPFIIILNLRLESRQDKKHQNGERKVVGGRAALLVSGRPAYGTGWRGSTCGVGTPRSRWGRPPPPTCGGPPTPGKGRGSINYRQQREWL